MYAGQTLFSQIMEHFPYRRFQTCVQRYQGDKRVRSLSCRDHFLAMAFAQLTARESLRDTVCCLAAARPQLYHMGLRGKIAKSTLADANQKRDWRIYADLAQLLIAKAKRLYAGTPLPVDFDNTVYALDATVIDLCMALFPWAAYKSTKSAVKLHTRLDIRGDIPDFVYVSDGKMADMEALDHIPIAPGTLTIMDRGYIDYARLHRFEQGKSFFIVRAKKNLQFTRRKSHTVDKSTGLRCDQTGVLKGLKQAKHYPAPLRRVRYRDVENARTFVFLTNHFELPALSIAEIYRSRWRVELFFKWIKQHLRIKRFFGVDANAVKTQIWIALCVYLLVAILRKERKIERSMYEILQVFSVLILEKMPVEQAFREYKIPEIEPCLYEQLELFDF